MGQYSAKLILVASNDDYLKPMSLLKRVSFWLMLLILPASSLMAQYPYLGFQWGVGSFKMNDLSEFNSYVIGGSHLEAELIDDYPPYYFYKTTIGYNYKRYKFGLLHSYQSTGSRYSLIDYSGEYLYDTKIKSNSFAFLVEYNLNPNKVFQISLFSEFGAISSKLLLEEVLSIDEEILSDESYALKASNAYWDPGIRISYPVLFFELYFSASYCMQFKGKGFYFIDNPDLPLYGGSSVPRNPDWTGYRLGIGININLNALGNI